MPPEAPRCRYFLCFFFFETKISCHAFMASLPVKNVRCLELLHHISGQIYALIIPPAINICYASTAKKPGLWLKPRQITDPVFLSCRSSRSHLEITFFQVLNRLRKKKVSVVVLTLRFSLNSKTFYCKFYN